MSQGIFESNPLVDTYDYPRGGSDGRFEKKIFIEADYLDDTARRFLVAGFGVQEDALSNVNKLIGGFAQAIQDASMVPTQEVLKQLDLAGYTGDMSDSLSKWTRNDRHRSETLSTLAPQDVSEVIRTHLTPLLRSVIELLGDEERAQAEEKIASAQDKGPAPFTFKSGMDAEAQQLIAALGGFPLHHADSVLQMMTNDLAFRAGLSYTSTMADLAHAIQQRKDGTHDFRVDDVMGMPVTMFEHSNPRYSTLDPQNLVATLQRGVPNYLVAVVWNMDKEKQGDLRGRLEAYDRTHPVAPPPEPAPAPAPAPTPTAPAPAEKI